MLKPHAAQGENFASHHKDDPTLRRSQFAAKNGSLAFQ